MNVAPDNQDNAHNDMLRQAYSNHPRAWMDNLYVYPVVSRRSGGVSVGVNLSPRRQCNFSCIYCQIDRSQPELCRRVLLPLLRAELEQILLLASRGDLFTIPPFSALPVDGHCVRDIAISGDAEPTTSPIFAQAVKLILAVRKRLKATDAPVVLITNASMLDQPNVHDAVRQMLSDNGAVWAKLDAGTQEYYQMVNRSSVPLERIVRNIAMVARQFPVTIQSMFMRIHGTGPDDSEIRAYREQLDWIVAQGGTIEAIQVYTVARRPQESYVQPLDRGELDRIAEQIARDRPWSVSQYYSTRDVTA